MSRSLLRGVMLLGLAAAAAWSVYQHRPTAALGEDAPEQAFSAARAMRHVRAIATRPHPAGSDANRAVRDYIVAELKALGCAPQVQRQAVHFAPGRASTVENVLARVPGTASTGAIVLAGHYDSVAFGPGAADDTSAVAVLLETLRAVSAAPPLKNDLIFLFTDGEESRKHGGVGCRGAYAFVNHHPWAKDTALVLNFDASGTSGPSYMYETGPKHGWLIAQLAAADCAPVSNSWMYDFYSRMPLDSDFTRFRQRGIPGLNFAFIDGVRRYHTALDTPDNLNPVSVQHHGACALGLARHFGAMTLGELDGPDLVYFNTVGYRLAWYPRAWVWPLNALALLLLAGALAFGLWRGALAWPRIVHGAVGLLAWVILGAIAAAVILLAGFRFYWIYVLDNSASLAGGGLLLGGAGYLYWLRRADRDTTGASTFAGALLLWAAACIGVSLVFPGASYLFVWPLLLGTAGLFALCAQKGEEPHPAAAAVLLITAAPALLLLTGTLYGFYTGLRVFLLPLLIPAAMMILALAAPHLHFALGRLKRPLVPALAVPGLCLVALGLAWFEFSPERPKLNCVTYALDTDSGAAYWLSSDRRPDAWTAQFFAQETRAPIAEFVPEAGEKAYLKAPAPALDLPAPEIDVLDDHVEAGRRRVTLRVRSPRQAPVLALYAEDGTTVHGGAVEGQKLLPVEGPWSLVYSIFPKEGITLELETDAGKPVTMRVVDKDYGLPTGPGIDFTPRPEWMICMPNTPDFNREPLKSDETVVSVVRKF